MIIDERCCCGSSLRIQLAANGLSNTIPRELNEHVREHLDDWRHRHRNCAEILTKVRHHFETPGAEGPANQDDTQGEDGPEEP